MTTQPDSKSRTVRLRIRRCDGPGKPSYWQSFDVAVKRGDGANILSCLEQIAANPVTTGGEKTTPVAWNSGCLEEVCGSCTMVVNGRARQACSALMDRYCPNEGDEITLEPMRKFPVYRDLYVDRTRMFSSLKRIKGWVPIDNLWEQGAGPKESPEAQQTRYKLSTCMSCGCCLDVCPQFQRIDDPEGWEGAFIGAAAISQVRYFNEHETGAELKGERLDVMLDKGGISDCGNAQNCVKACPKEIPLTESIAAIGGAATAHAIRQFFKGK